MKKNTLIKAIAIILVLVLTTSVFTACGSSKNTSDDNVRVLKMGIAGSKDDVHYPLIENFIKELETTSGGALTIDLYTDGTLGEERDLLEGCQMGSVDMCGTANGPLTGFVPGANVFNLPYLFENFDHVDAVLTSDIPEALDKEYEAAGLKRIGYSVNDFRAVMNDKKPINSLSDCKGVKIRCLENECMVDTYTALGFEVTTMPMSEVVTAVQNGTIDGADFNPYNVLFYNYYEQCKYLTLSNTFAGIFPITMSLDVWNSLSEEEQGWIEEAMKKAYDIQSETRQKFMVDDVLAELEDADLKIVELKDKEEWKAATKSVFDKYAASLDADLIEDIQNIEY